MSTLLVCSNGGHLKQLDRLHTHLRGIEGPYRWVTFDTPQSRSLLAGRDVELVPYVGGRDPLNGLRNLPYAHRILTGDRFDAVVSTGSAVALPYLSVARSRGIACHYIESAARLRGPSLTGRLIRMIPGVSLYTQHRAWEGGPWRYRGSVFDSFQGVAKASAPARPTRVVVTLGTYRGVEFTRLVERLLEILPPEADVLWQVGYTDVARFDIDAQVTIPEAELSRAMGEADVVVAHAGVGTALAAFEVGKCPVLVPRRAVRGEAVDDHQAQIAGELAERGLSISVDVESLSGETLSEAMCRGVAMPEAAPIFETVG